MASQHFHVRAIALVLTVTALHAAAAPQESPLLILVTDVWRNPIADARVYRGVAPSDDDVPLTTSGEDGRCTVSLTADSDLTVDHPDFAPLVISIAEGDVDRGYVTAILFEGGAIQASFRVGGEGVETDYAFVTYADPTIYGGIIQAKSKPDGNLRFNHVPAGLAYVTMGVNLGGARRSETVLVQVDDKSTSYVQLRVTPGSAGVRGTVVGVGGNPVEARLSGTLLFNRRIEELAAETDAHGNFAIVYLPQTQLVLRAFADDGLMKRVVVPLAADTGTERDIRFDEGATLTVSVENAPQFEWLDVFVLDGQVAPEALRDPSDRATYVRAARNARLRATDAPVRVPGVLPGDYTLVVLATTLEDQRRTTSVSQFQPLTITRQSTTARVEFPVTP